MRNKDCKLCGLYKTATNVCIDGDGPTDATVLFVGEAPGRDEDRVGKPFQGQSGKILRGEIARANIESFRITNLVRCRPPGNRPPTNDEVKACRPYLDAELAAVKPGYVVTLGGPASKHVLRKSKITQDHGQVIAADKHPFVGMPVFHPAYILRDPSKLPAFQADLQRLVREMAGKREPISVNWCLVTRHNVDEFLAEFERAEEFAFDTETSGLLMHDPHGEIRTLQIAFKDRTWVIRLKIHGSPMPRHETQYNFVRSLVEMSRGKFIVAQNGKFDNNWLSCQYGMHFHLSFDVGLAHHILDENSPHGLKEMSRQYLDAPEYDLPLAVKLDPVKYGKLDEFYEYGAYDAHFTLQLGLLFDGMLRKNRTLRKIFYSLVMPAARAFLAIEREPGITLDMPKFEATEIDVRKRLARTERELNAMAAKVGAKDVNWNSPQQVGKFLYGTLGLTATVLTDSGANSTGEEALNNIKDDHPIANKLVEFRELAKFLSTYLEGWKEYTFGDRMFLSTKLHGTVTGRYSSRLHQVPRDGTIRNLVIAPPDWSFVQADLSQAELRAVAETSQDPEMIRCFKTGVDIHWRTLMYTLLSGGSGDYYEPALMTAGTLADRKIYELEEACAILLKHGHEVAIKTWKGWKEGRKKAKGINFGYVYGMGWNSFIDYADLNYGFRPTPDESQTLRTGFFQLYRGLEPWHKRQRSLVRMDGEVRNPIGRVRRLPGAFSSDKSLVGEAERMAINSPIQGWIGDIKAMAVVEMVETLPPYSVRVVGEVHDSILINVRTAELDTWLPKIRQIMQQPKLMEHFNVKLTVPLGADIEVGPWGAGTTYRKDLM